MHLLVREDGQLHELPFGRTTIGSSAKCSLRLERPGVQPLHCLIVHGPEGISIRSWAGDAQLNGVPFVETAASVGDCLRIGAVELEVVEWHAAPPPIAAPISKSITVGQVSAEQDLATPHASDASEVLSKENVAHETLLQQVADLQEENLQVVMERESVSGTLARTLAELAANRQQLVELNAQALERQQLSAQNQRLEVEVREASARASEFAREQAEAARDHQKLVDEHAALRADHQQLRDENARLHEEVHHVAGESATYRGERDEARGQIERLQTESHALTAEMAAIVEERTTLAKERSELQLQVAALEAHISQLDNDYSVMAVAKLAAFEERDHLRQQNEQLQTQIAELDEANSSLIADKASLTTETARLASEQHRLDDLERQIVEERTGRENTSAELYRALLQLSELEEQASRNATAISAHQALSEEREQLLCEVGELREQVQSLNAERAVDESARQAIVDEAAALRESQQKLADENSSLQVRLTETQEQLNNARQDQIAGANAAAELERQLAATQQAECAAAAAASDLERQLAEQACKSAETTDELRRQLLAADNAQQLLGQARDEWRQNCVQAQHESTKQSARIADLEQQLLAAEEAAQELSQQVAGLERKGPELVVESGRSFAPTDAAGEVWAKSRPAVESTEACEIGGLSGGQDLSWGQVSLPRSAAVDSGESAVAAESSLAESPFAGVNESLNSSDTDPWMVPKPESEPLGCTSDPEGDWETTAGENPWRVASSATESEAVGELGWEAQTSASELDATAWAGGAIVATVEQEDSPFAEFLAGKHGAAEARPNCGEPSEANAEPQVEPAADLSLESSNQVVEDRATPVVGREQVDEVTASLAAVAPPQFIAAPEIVDKPAELAATNTPPTSFIERYSHLFEENAAEVTELPQPWQRPTGTDGGAAAPRTKGFEQGDGSGAAAIHGDEEESLEQYMAKLMQRVRGESPTSATVPAKVVLRPIPSAVEAAPSSRNAAAIGTSTNANPSEVVAGSSSSSDGAQDTAEVAVDWEAIARRAAATAPKADMGALRALANETARRAIGRHELRKHRRDAVTKIIVSSLAGVTSLWLVLDSPSWRDIQFITACVSLVAAAYWAGETFREMLESWRAAAYEGPQAARPDAGPTIEPDLPIDIEEDR